MGIEPTSEAWESTGARTVDSGRAVIQQEMMLGFAERRRRRIVQGEATTFAAESGFLR